MHEPLDENTTFNIYKYGNYYNPAHSHYNRITNVVCDRCLKKNLNICIGWEDKDLCLKCVSDIDTIIKNNPYADIPIIDKITIGNKPFGIVTKMMQSMFSSKKKNHISLLKWNNHNLLIALH